MSVSLIDGHIDPDKPRMLIFIPNEGNYVEILGHKIYGYESFNAFCEHLNKYAEMEVKLEKLQCSYDCELAYRKELHKQAKTEAVKECLEWVLSLFPEDNNFTTISRFTVNQKLKEMVGEG